MMVNVSLSVVLNSEVIGLIIGFPDYMPCTMPLNVSFTFDNNITIPLHPLDLTGTPPRAQDTSVCIGLIQSADSVLAVSNNPIGDIVLGVPFMRSVYMVMSYYVPDLQTGIINPAAYTRAVDPRVGLLNLTDPHQAMDDFNTVRVLQRPLEENRNNPSAPTRNNSAAGGGKNIAVPIVIGVVSFFALCFALFFLRWWMMRRRFKKEQQTQLSSGGEGGQAGGFLARMLANPNDAGRYGLAKQGTESNIALGQMGGTTLRNPGGARNSALSEDELRKIKFDAYMRNSYRTDSSGSIYDATMVETFNQQDDSGAGEFGVRRRPMKDRVASDYRVDSPEGDPWDPRTALNWGKGSQSGFPSSRSPDPTAPAHNRGETVSVPLLSASPSPPTSPRMQLPPGVVLPEIPDTQSSALRHAKDDTGVNEEGTTESRTTCGLAGVGTTGRRDRPEHPKFDHGRYDVRSHGPR